MRHLLLAVGVLAATPALPCSGPTCEQYFDVVPRPGSTLPANAPAIGRQHLLLSEASWDGGTTRLVTASQLSITLVDGGAVAWTDGGTSDEPWALLDGSLVAGQQLQLEATAPSLGGAPCTSSGVVTVGPAAPLPTSAGVISVASLVTREHAPALCGGPVGRVQHAQLRVEPAAELGPWLALTRWELEVDGSNYATSDFGRLGASPETGTPAEAGQHPVLTLHAQCDALDVRPTGDARLGPGAHQVRLLARIVGVPAPVPSNTLTVTFQCEAPDAGTVVDAGVTTADAGVTTNPDAGAAPGGGAPLNGRGCGCAGIGELALLGGLLVWGRRPRKSCPRQPS